MTSYQPFTDPIITQKRGKDLPYVEIIEEIYVDSNAKALLTEIPYKANRVQFLEQTGGSGGGDSLDGGNFSDTSTSASETVIYPIIYEITDGSPADNQFVCDYVQGVLTFNVSQVGAKFLVKYTGSGFHFFPSSRVSYQQNLDGTITTLKEVLDSSTDTISNIQTATNNANTAASNATTATANFQSLLDQQLIIYKPSVATFADIATTYPTPSLGWTVTEKQYGVRYRYDGTSWEDIGTSLAGDGFNVSISATAPANTNILWLEVPNTNRMARIVKSSTAPTDTSVIWWEP